MRYFYRAPPDRLKPYIGSFYLMDMPRAQSGNVRVEIPHIRFLIRGASTLSVGGNTNTFRSPEVLVCGPSFQTGMVDVSDDTLIVGASLTPVGWHALTGVSAEDYANQKTGMGSVRLELDMSEVLTSLADVASDEEAFTTVETFVWDALLTVPPPRPDFVNTAMAWATDPECPGIETLVAQSGLSSRQVDRLCRYYFGGSPKQVHRVFRSLNIAYRLTIDGADDWQEVVAPFYDQSHFIRDFKDRIGCTPSEFTGERLMMMRHDLEQKAKIADIPRYCLIG